MTLFDKKSGQLNNFNFMKCLESLDLLKAQSLDFIREQLKDISQINGMDARLGENTMIDLESKCLEGKCFTFYYEKKALNLFFKFMKDNNYQFTEAKF